MSEPRYGWVMVALGGFMTCIAIGAMFSLAVFLQPITQSTGWSHTARSATASARARSSSPGRSCSGWASSSPAARRARSSSSSPSAC
jgi:hypothetical protein